MILTVLSYNAWVDDGIICTLRTQINANDRFLDKTRRELLDLSFKVSEMEYSNKEYEAHINQHFEQFPWLRQSLVSGRIGLNR